MNEQTNPCAYVGNGGPAWYKVELKQPDGSWTDPRSMFARRVFAFACDAEIYITDLIDIGVGYPMRVVACTVFGERLQS